MKRRPETHTAGADVQYAQRLLSIAARQIRQELGGGRINGAIARANATQIGLSCETVPSSEAAAAPHGRG